MASVAELQLRLLRERPYAFTEEELYVRVHGLRRGLSEQEIAERYEALRDEVFAKPQACLRASPLAKDPAGLVARVPERVPCAAVPRSR